MSAPTFIQPVGLFGLSGFNAADLPATAQADALKMDRSTTVTAGLVSTAIGSAALFGGYHLYKNKHPVAGIVVALLFGSGAVIGPLMLTGIYKA